MKRAIWLALAWLALCAEPAQAADKHLNVVATLSMFEDLVKTIGGDHVTVASIASPKFDPHFIEPKPSDVLKVKRSQLFVHAGLDLELWRWPLVDAAGNRSVFLGSPGELDLSQGVSLLEVPTRLRSRAEGDIHLYGNPHYWLHPDNVRVMAQAIVEKLSAVDSAHQETYRSNMRSFIQRLDRKIAEWRAKLEPFRGRELVAYHREYSYLADFAGLRINEFLEPKPGIPPTPQHLQFIEGYIAERKIPAIVQSSFYPRQAAQAVAKRTGAQPVILCQNVRELPACSDYIAMMDYNVNQLASALQ